MIIPCIILNYNTSSDCMKCVNFLCQQMDVEIEIIFVDNCSSDEDRNVLRQYCQEQGFAFIANDKNLGYNAGNNVGLRYAAKKGYDYALIANPDMEFPQTDYLKRLHDVMEEDKLIAVCGSDIVTPEGIHQSPMKPEGNWRHSFGWITSLFRKKPKDTYSFIDHYEQSHYCSKVSGCCLMVRMSFIQEIGFFDEYPFLYCEEAILSRQVEQSSKWKMYYLAETQAIHRHIKNEKGNPIPRFKQWKRSRLHYIKHYSGDHWLGKKIAILSFLINITLTVTAIRIKNIFTKQ